LNLICRTDEQYEDTSRPRRPARRSAAPASSASDATCTRIFCMKKLLPAPHRPNSPIDSGGAISREATRSASMFTSAVMPSRSGPSSVSAW
jgi:hypothetical protein